MKNINKLNFYVNHKRKYFKITYIFCISGSKINFTATMMNDDENL